MSMSKSLSRMMLLLAVFMLLPGMSKADDTSITVQYLVVTQTDGSVAKFTLSDVPVISFDADSMVVTSVNEVLRTDLAGIADYAFNEENITTGINGIAQKNQVGVIPSFQSGSVDFSGLKDGNTIHVFSMNGQAVQTVKVDAQGNATVSLSQLPKGIYIIKAPSQSYKVVNK